MRRTVEAAVARGVAIGAHPSLPDLAGFGRREMRVSADETYAMTLYQIGALAAMARAAGAAASSRQAARRALQHGREGSRAGRCDRDGRARFRSRADPRRPRRQRAAARRRSRRACRRARGVRRPPLRGRRLADGPLENGRGHRRRRCRGGAGDLDRSARRSGDIERNLAHPRRYDLRARRSARRGDVRAAPARSARSGRTFASRR